MLIGAPKLLAKGTSMKLRSIALVLAVALASAAAYAQSGVYADHGRPAVYPGGHHSIRTPAAIPISTVPGSSAPATVFTTTLPIPVLLPLLNKLKTGPVVIGIDGRGDTLRRTELRLATRSPGRPFQPPRRPQEQCSRAHPLSSGRLRHRPHQSSRSQAHYSNNFIYQFGIGADHKIHKNIDWRVLKPPPASSATTKSTT